MTNWVVKYCRSSTVTMHVFAGTFTNKRAHLSLEHYRRIIRCDIDENYMEVSLDSLRILFARQLINRDSYLTEYCDVEEETRQ